MNDYRLPNLLIPEELYRVDYLGSRTTYSEKDGFIAADTSKVCNSQDIDAFKDDIVKHFTWSNREPMPFISLFSDFYHAANWGLKQPWKDETTHPRTDEWALRFVKTKLIFKPCIFKLQDLVKRLNLKLPEKAEQFIEGVYLCLHNIPAAAIDQHWNPQEVKKGTINRLSQKPALLILRRERF